MALFRQFLLLAFAACLLTPPIAGAQNPWTVKVYSTMNPLPLGVCAAVRLELMDPVTGATPRRPTGDYVTITDFDVTVKSPAGNSVAPNWITAYNLLACGCQSGSVGDNAVVTATYPAQALPDRARMPGVSFQVNGAFSLSKGQNGINPPSCSTPSVAPAVVVPPLPVSPTTGTRTATPTISLAPPTMPAPAPPPAPVAAPVTAITTKVSTNPVAIAPSAPLVLTGAPLPQIPPEILAAWASLGIPASADSIYGATIDELKRVLTAWMTANGQTGLIPLSTGTTVGRTVTPTPVSATAPASAPILPPTSPASLSPIAGSSLPSQPVVAKTATGTTPTGLRLLPGVPVIASLAWDSMPNAVTYSLRRGVALAAPVERVTRTQSAEKSARDTVPDPSVKYLYTLVVTYEDGTFGTSPAVEFLSPPLKNPTGFTAKDLGDGNVKFEWQVVPDAMGVRIDGPGFPNNKLSVATASSATYPNIPPGANSWKLTALYAGNNADDLNPSIATAVVRILPPHPMPWLTKSNGAGIRADVQMPREASFECFYIPPRFAPVCVTEATLPNQLKYPFDAEYAKWVARQLPGEGKAGIYQWLDMEPILNLWDEPGQPANEAVYGNPGDLGVGRRSHCVQRNRATIPGVYTVCYAAAHGIAPGLLGFNDPEIITRPGELQDPQFLLAMVIAKDPTGTVFLVLTPSKVRELYKIGKYDLSPTVTLDTQGPKLVPHACLSCHGGTYNTTTHKVDGASFLPIDPNLQSFAPEADKADMEEKIRRINQIIATSGSAPAITSYINALYGNAVSMPGRTATPDFVPPGWQQEAGFYRSVVRPYCAMCHLAAPASWNFASWDNFRGNAALIKAAVCNAHTMPHSELQFKAFWTKDTGPVYLPGLLASTLVLDWPVSTPGAPPSCP